MSSDARKRASGFLIRSDLNRAVQAHKMARVEIPDLESRGTVSSHYLCFTRYTEMHVFEINEIKHQRIED